MCSLMRRAFMVASSHRCAGFLTNPSPKCRLNPGLSFSSSKNSVLCSSLPLNLLFQCSSCLTQLVQKEPISLLPLCERPDTHSSSVEELFKWRSWAQNIATSVGDKYRIADGGPDTGDLLRELDWMLEDAVSHFLPPCMPNGLTDNRTKKPNSTIRKAQASSSETLLEAAPDVLHINRVGALKALKWRDIKSIEPPNFQRVVYLRASLEELSALWIERVQKRRPFQYVVGSAHWRDFVLFVKEGVLIPRPETEQMIDLAQEVITAQPDLSKGFWADLGTGSGALAIGLGSILHPQGNVVAVDMSNEALSIATLNIQKYGLQEKVRVLHGSWFSPLEDLKGKLAGVLSNPPYIPSSHIPTLQVEVGRYEPRDALDGGQQGIDDLTVLCQGATWALQSGGYIILETNGGGQAETVARLLESMPGDPFCDVQLIKDYAGVVRFVRAKHV